MTRPALSAKQLKVITMKMPRIMALVGVTGSGKSFAANLRAYADLCSLPSGSMMLITGNTTESVRRNVIRELLKLDEGVGYLDWREQGGRLSTRGGCEAVVIGINAEGAERRLQGGSVAYWYADEPTTYPRTAFDMAMTRCRGVVNNRLRMSPVLMTLNPDDEDHFVKTQYLDRAEELGIAVFNFTFFDNPMIDHNFVEEISSKFTGVFYERMIEGKWSSGSSDRAFPEFDSSRHVQDVERPRYLEWYGSLDPGYADNTGYLCGYYDFQRARLVITGEMLATRCNTTRVSEAIKECERLAHQKPPRLRVSDTSLQVIADLNRLHGLTFIPARKDDKDAAINNLRVMIGQNRVIVSDSAVSVLARDDQDLTVSRGAAQLIGQLRRCRWDKTRRGWLRSEADGHFDLVDALIYMCRHIDQQKNPAPAFDGREVSDTFHIVRRRDSGVQSMAAILNNARKLARK